MCCRNFASIISSASGRVLPVQVTSSTIMPAAERRFEDSAECLQRDKRQQQARRQSSTQTLRQTSFGADLVSRKQDDVSNKGLEMDAPNEATTRKTNQGEEDTSVRDAISDEMHSGSRLRASQSQAGPTSTETATDSQRQRRRKSSANSRSSQQLSGHSERAQAGGVPSQRDNIEPKVSLTRNESDTTASSMSTCENCPLPVKTGGRMSYLKDNNQDEEQQSSSQTSSSRRHRRSEVAAHSSTSGDEERRAGVSAVRRRASRSQPPSAGAASAEAARCSSNVGGSGEEQLLPKSHSRSSADRQNRLDSSGNKANTRRAVSVSPSLSNSINIRHILENVAQVEGDFVDPSLAYKVAMDALDSPCWSTKVEGILALIRIAAHHQQVLLQPLTSNLGASGHLHEVTVKLAQETSNLRSTVARSAIFALGDLCARLGRLMEPEMDLVCRVLLQKSNENAAFIRDDIRRALDEMVNSLTPWRLAKSLIAHGAQHKSANVRRMASQFVAALVDRLGAAKCLVGAREISSALLTAACKFAQDNSPHTRYYGRLILSKLMHHSSFDRLLRRNVSSSLYRSTLGVIESVKRRGPGELPQGD